MVRFVSICILLILIMPFADAKPINTTVYRTLSAQSYRHNYRNNINNRVMPYWQAQSNFSTRNRVYRNYSNYNNAVQNYNNMYNQYRSNR